MSQLIKNTIQLHRVVEVISTMFHDIKIHLKKRSFIQLHFVKNDFQKLTNVLNSSPLATIDGDTISSLYQLFPDEPISYRIPVNATLQQISYQDLIDELQLMCRKRRSPGLSGISRNTYTIDARHPGLSVLHFQS